MSSKEKIVFPVWVVYRNNDDRTYGPITDVCGTEALANKVAHRSGWYGGDAPVRKRYAARIEGRDYLLDSGEPIHVVHSVDDQQRVQRELTRLRALEKLSDAEREALGV